MLEVERVSDRLLWKFFEKIDTNKDGLISFGEYLAWVSDFLAVLAYFGLEYYIVEDDEDLAIGADMILSNMLLVKTKEYIASDFHFSSLDLARRVRNRMLKLIEQYDSNHNFNLEE